MTLDNRPILALHLSTALPSPKNPRGFFDAGMDVTTPLGRIEFNIEMTSYGKAAVQVAQSLNAQGAIIWDAEGQAANMPNYIGDPEMTYRLAPELQFSNCYEYLTYTLRKAGLWVGCTIRPTVLCTFGAKWEQIDPAQVYTRISDVIARKTVYARDQWGMTRFYLDSNDPNQIWNSNWGYLYPEHAKADYFQYTQPYAELRRGELLPPVDGAYLLNVSDAAGALRKRHVELVDAIRAKRIVPLVNGWVPSSPEVACLRNIYRDAALT